MFSGLMSRWTTPRDGRSASASATSRAIRRRLVHRQLALPPKPVPQALALDVGHSVVAETVGLPES